MSATYAKLPMVCSPASSTAGRAAVALLALGLLGADCGDDSRVASGTDCDSNQDCDDGLFCNGQEYCAGPKAGCRYYPPPCGDGFSCDESSDRCARDCEVAVDADGDGYDSIQCGGDDCDDDDGERFPGNAEVCDRADHDEDCDPTSFGNRDVDGDGYADAACANRDDRGRTIAGDDCDDGVAGTHPGQNEACNDVDDDCDGAMDEGVLVTGYADTDRDGYGAGGAVSVCAATTGFAIYDGDCNDASAQVHPSQDESCNGADDDCDTQVDEGVLDTLYTDADHDGFGTGSGSSGCASSVGVSIHAGDCDDANPELSPGTLRCVVGGQGTEYQLCSATGIWAAGTCPQGRSCISQPGGFGVCVP